MTKRNPKKAKASRKEHQTTAKASDGAPSDQLPQQRLKSVSASTSLHHVVRDETSFGTAFFHDVFGDTDDDLKKLGDGSKQGKDDDKYA